VPRGVPLTPEQVERAAEVYGRTGNYAEAARAIGAAETAVRTRLVQRGDADRRALNARACEKGVRDGTRALRYGLSLARERFDAAATADEFRAVMSATSDATRTLQTIATAHGDRALKRLQREKMRAELSMMNLAGPDGLARLILPAVLVERDTSTPGRDPVCAEPETDTLPR
jgi:hypothetical protein